METTSPKLNLPPDIFPYTGDWDTYLDELHTIFIETLSNRKVLFSGLPVSLRKNPTYKDKSFTFWHLISEGEKEEERIPDIRRCERLAWIHWIIENAATSDDIFCWENKRGTHNHIVIWFDKENYVVILEKRKSYFLLKTAYFTKPHRASTFRKERDNNKAYCF